MFGSANYAALMPLVNERGIAPGGAGPVPTRCVPALADDLLAARELR